MTGDLVGTLRYMSPEQTLAKRVVVDQRSDIYSLGATIYEMIALRPVLEGANRQELLKQIAFDEPTKLRSLDRSVPSELAIIIHQALAKNPEERYATAGEMADDLRAFCQNRSIKAKPPSQLQRGSKWARSHQSIVAAAMVVLIVITVALAASTWIISQDQAQTAEALDRAETNLEEAERQRERADANFRRARETVDTFLTDVAESKLLDLPG